RGVGETEALRVRAHDARHRLVADEVLEGLQAEGRLAVGVQGIGLDGAVFPAPPGHHVDLARAAQIGEVALAPADPDAGRDHRPAAAAAPRRRREAEVAAAPARGPEGELRGLLLVIAVDAFVEPG